MRRIWSGFALASLLMLALAGCGRQVTVAGAGVRSTTGVITSVQIVRMFGLTQPTIPPFEATSDDAAVAQSLAQTIKSLPPFPNGTYHCPIDFGVTYTLTFQSGSAPALSASVDAQGCQGLTITGESHARWTIGGPFWPQVAQTFHVSQTFLWAAPHPSNP